MMKLVSNRVEVRTKVAVSSLVLIPIPIMVSHTHHTSKNFIIPWKQVVHVIHDIN